MRTFARKDSFKRHFGLKKDGGKGGEEGEEGEDDDEEASGRKRRKGKGKGGKLGDGAGDGGKCWEEGNLAGIPELLWASKWLFEPIVVRYVFLPPLWFRILLTRSVSH